MPHLRCQNGVGKNGSIVQAKGVMRAVVAVSCEGRAIFGESRNWNIEHNNLRLILVVPVGMDTTT